MLSTLFAICGFHPRQPSESDLVLQGYTALDQWLNAAVKKSMHQAGVTGMGVAVINTDGVILQRGYGFADKANKVSVGENTRFRAGSVSKPFTSIAVHQLAEEGLLDLDAPLQSFIPDFSIKSRHGDTAEITLRHILSHHAGLPSDILDGMWTDQPAPLSEVVGKLQGSYTTSAPGTAMAYSNIGFSLAGVAIEQVSGLSFEEYMQRNVLTRLGMAASSFSPRAEHPQLSLSYINGKPVKEAGIRDTPAGALVSTTGDLAKMAKAILNRGRIDKTETVILQPKTVADMLTIQSYPSPYTAGNIAALGWMRVPSNLPCGHDLVWHNGQTLGHSALVYLSCQAGLGIVMLSNSPATEVMDSLARDIMGHAYTIRYGGKQHKTTASMAESLPGTATSAEGQYVSTAGLITVSGQGDRYYTEFSGQKWQLDEIAAGQYKARLRLLGFVPVASKELRAATIHIRQVSVASGNDKLVFIEGDGAQQFLASSVLPQEPPPIWADRTGEYELVTRLHESKFLSIGPVELGLRDGIYVVVLSIDDQTVDYPLAFHGDNGASVQGFGRMLGAALEFVQPDSFDLMGLRFKRLTG
jgi:CubicO group peptidase (beta-lactamase class C family)